MPILFASNDSTLRVGSLCGDPREFEGFCVCDRKMTRNMRRDDRMLGRSAVEIMSGRVSFFGDEGVVVSKPHDPFALGLVRRVSAKFFDDLFDRFDLANGWAVEVHSLGDEPGSGEVTMGVDEPWYQRPPTNVMNLGSRCNHRLDLRARSHRGDSFVLDENRLCDFVGPIHREHVGIHECLARWRRRAVREHRERDPQPNDQHQQ